MHFLFKSILVGLFSSSIVTAYRYTLKKVEYFRHGIFESFHERVNVFQGAALIFAAIMISSALGYIMKKYPKTKGGGVALVKGVLKGKLSFDWFNDVVFKFIGGILSLAAGLSMGIEGPAVQLGAEMAEGVSGIRNSDEEKKYFITAGAAAGFAAAFGAPFSAIIFSIEEFGKKISEKLLVAVFIAASIGGICSSIFFGDKYFFNPSLSGSFGTGLYLAVILFALLMTGLGRVYIIISDLLENFYKEIRIRPVLKPLLTVIVGIIASLYMHDITGGGHHMSEQVLAGEFTLKYLMILLVLKMLFSLYCSTSGIPGGVFIPIISIGIIAGKIFGIMAVEVLGVPLEMENYFAILGFVAALSILIRIPLTALGLAIETTGAVELLMPAIIMVMASHVFSRILNMESIYDTGYKKLLKQEGV